MLTGHIDLCRGRYILGWAIPRDRTAHCRIEVKDAAGRTLAETIAHEHRDDLARVGEGRTDFGFRVGVPLTDRPGPVQIWADGVEMPGSPVLLDDDQYDAELTIAGGRVSGWVCSRGPAPVLKSVILVDQDNRHVLTLPVQPDASETDPLFRPARFSASLPTHCFGQAELCLLLKIGGVVVARGFGPCRLDGYLDRLSDAGCTGWLFSRDAPDRFFDLCIYRDGVLAGTTRTTIERADVSRRFAAAKACGFELSLAPEDRAGPSLRHISVRLSGSDRELFGGPFMVGRRAQAVQAMYDAIGGLAVDRTGAAVLRHALVQTLEATREKDDVRIQARPWVPQAESTQRLAIIVPVYADPIATSVCIESVLRTRRAASDSVIIVNDNPDEPSITAVLDAHALRDGVFVLSNVKNEGFIASVNRALGFARAGDVLLLNADTELYPGAIDEMHHVLHSAPDIGSVTALSNNATLFSYPHASMTERVLEDIPWHDLAALALRENAGATVDIPTGHGFCMMIRRATLEEVGHLDPAFGRGYGEENDFSIRASDRGWRHVLAGGALVRHDEARSFGPAREKLVEANLGVLLKRFPEYRDRIDVFARADPVRRLRWPLDFHRLRRMKAAGFRLEVIIENWLDGGMRRAASDIDAVVHVPNVHALRMIATKEGTITLHVEGLQLLSVFQPDEAVVLFDLLATLDLERVVVHHLLGFTEDFVRKLQAFITRRPALFHVHDFYYACPRVTMIDASATFCGGAAADRCARCVSLDGRHTAYRMGHLSPAEHRELFRDLLAAARHVMAPSQDSANRLAALMPGVTPLAVPHPQTGMVFPIGVRRGSATDICLLGAIGPHKGSATLLALARHARLNHPDLRFHVVGFTNLDAELEAVDNVTVTGKYELDDLPGMVEATEARIALFLHGWPETFSYTLSEAVGLGLIPVVPDIGAPAERVREAGFGVIYPFPIDVAQVGSVLQGIGAGTVPFSQDGALPRGFDTTDSYDRLRALYHGGLQTTPRSVPTRVRRHKTGTA